MVKRTVMANLLGTPRSFTIYIFIKPLLNVHIFLFVYQSI